MPSPSYIKMSTSEALLADEGQQDELLMYHSPSTTSKAQNSRRKRKLALLIGAIAFLFILGYSYSHQDKRSASRTGDVATHAVQVSSPHLTPTSAIERSPRIIKVTLQTYANISAMNDREKDMQTKYQRSMALHEAHAKLHNHGFYVERIKIFEGKLMPAIYNKCSTLMKVLLNELSKPADKRAEWLFWFDIDTVITNSRIPLDLYLPPPDRDDIHMTASNDLNGLNNGIFYLRVSSWSAAFLAASITWPLQHDRSKVIFAEQSAMQDLIDKNDLFKKGYQQIPRHWINAYGSSEFDGHKTGDDITAIKPGYFLLHLPGPAKWFRPWFNDYLTIAESHNAEWDIDPYAAGMDKEVARFWAHIPDHVPA